MSNIATKDQERQALAKIKNIVEGLGPDSYIGTAFQGVLEDAAQNIEDDAAYSQYERAEAATKKLDAATERLKELGGLVDSLKEQLRQQEIKIAKHTLPVDLYQDLWVFVTAEGEESRKRMASAADIMAEMADTPTDIAFTRSVTLYREAKARAEKCERMASELDAHEPEGV